MEPKIIDTTNKLSYHFATGLISFASIFLFLVLGIEVSRAVAATAFFLLFLVMVIGPIMRLWRHLARMLLWELPWGWRGELGIWFVLLSIVHGFLVMQVKNWQLPAINIGSLLGLIALFWAMVLAATSFSKVIKFIGVDQWRWLHTVGTYVIFYLLATHIIRYTFGHPRGYTGPNWLPWLYLIMIVTVIVLQFTAFVKSVIYYQKSKKPEELEEKK